MGRDIKAIKEHIGELNNHEKRQDEKITRNTNNIGWIIKIGGGLVTIGSIVAIALKIAGFY